MQQHRSIAVLLVSAVLLAGCGGDDDGAEEAGTTTTVATSTTDATETTELPSDTESAQRESTDPAKAEQAEAAVLRMEDFPEGWEEQDPEAGLGLEETWQELTG